MKKLELFVMPFMAISLLASCNSPSTSGYITVNTGLGCFEDKSIIKKFKIGDNHCLKDVMNYYIPTYEPLVAEYEGLEPPVTKPIYCFTDDKTNQFVDLNDNVSPGMELTCHYFPSYEDYHSFCVGEMSRYYGIAASKCDDTKHELLDAHNSVLDLLSSMDSIDYMYIQEGLRIALSMGYEMAARSIKNNKPVILAHSAAVTTDMLINNHLSIGLGEAFIYFHDCLGETGKGFYEEEIAFLKQNIPNVHPNGYLALSKAFSIRYLEDKKNYLDNRPALEGREMHFEFEKIFYDGLVAAKDDFDCLTAIGDTCGGYYHSLADAVGASDEERERNIVDSFKKVVDEILKK